MWSLPRHGPSRRCRPSRAISSAESAATNVSSGARWVTGDVVWFQPVSGETASSVVGPAATLPS